MTPASPGRRLNLLHHVRLPPDPSRSALTVSNKGVGKRVVVKHSQIHRCSIANFVVDIVETSRKEYANAALDAFIGYIDAELSQAADCCSADDGVLEDDAIVNVSDVLRWLSCFWALDAEQMQNADRELRELTVLDELAQLC